MLSDRDAILGAIPDCPTPPVVTDAVALNASGMSPWDEFETRLTALGGRVVRVPTLENWEAAVGIPLASARMDVELGANGANLDIWDAEIGVTGAEWAIAETGTLLLSAGPGKERMNSLAPPTHIVLIREDRIKSRLEEAIAELSDRTSVLITGPSRTADIEGVLVRGVHGPGQLIVVVYAG